MNDAISRDQLQSRDQLMTDNQQLRNALAQAHSEAAGYFTQTLELDNRRFFWKCAAFFLAVALIACLVGFGYYVWGGRP